MTLFPFFEDIDGKRIAIIGGGYAAKEKFFKLYRFTHNLTIVAPEMVFAVPNDVEVKKKIFAAPDAEGIDIAVIATDNDTSDRFAQQLCKNKGIRVNVVGHPEMSDFDFPELLKKGDLVIGITSSNVSPAAAAYVRGEVEKMIPDSMEAILKRLGEAIPVLAERIADDKQRSNVLGMMFDYLLEKDNNVPEDEFWDEVERRSAGMKINSIWEGKERPAK